MCMYMPDMCMCMHKCICVYMHMSTHIYWWVDLCWCYTGSFKTQELRMRRSLNHLKSKSDSYWYTNTYADLYTEINKLNLCGDKLSHALLFKWQADLKHWTKIWKVQQQSLWLSFLQEEQLLILNGSARCLKIIAISSVLRRLNND